MTGHFFGVDTKQRNHKTAKNKMENNKTATSTKHQQQNAEQAPVSKSC